MSKLKIDHLLNKFLTVSPSSTSRSKFRLKNLHYIKFIKTTKLEKNHVTK